MSWGVDPQKRSQGDCQVDGFTMPAIRPGLKGQTIESERHVSVVGVRRSVICAQGVSDVIGRRDSHHIPPALRRVTMQILVSHGGVRNHAVSQLGASKISTQSNLLERLACRLLRVLFFDFQGSKSLIVKPGQWVREGFHKFRLPPRRKSRVQQRLDLKLQFSTIQASRWDAQLCGYSRKRGDAVIRRKREPDVSQTDLMSQKVEKIGQLLVQSYGHGLDVRRIRPHTMAQDVVCGKADREQISSRPGAQMFVENQFPGKLQFPGTRQRSGGHVLYGICTRRFS